MIPSRYIHDTFNQHQHYYGAFFAIDKVERSYGSSNPPPYARLKSKRVNTSSTSVELMSKWRPEGNGREELKQEIDAAKQRERKEDGESSLIYRRAAHNHYASKYIISFCSLYTEKLLQELMAGGESHVTIFRPQLHVLHTSDQRFAITA